MHKSHKKARHNLRSLPEEYFESIVSKLSIEVGRTILFQMEYSIHRTTHSTQTIPYFTEIAKIHWCENMFIRRCRIHISSFSNNTSQKSRPLNPQKEQLPKMETLHLIYGHISLCLLWNLHSGSWMSWRFMAHSIHLRLILWYAVKMVCTQKKKPLGSISVL